MIGLTLKHLRYFDALARHAHFGRAADACGISQPALSVQIKELEAMLGSPLVERGSRNIRLTSLGTAFLDRARKILVQVGELDDLARSATGPLAGQLRLGIIPTVAPYLLPQVMAALSTHMPTLELYPRESVTKSLIADLLDSRLDAAIVALPISEPALQEFALFKEDFVLVRPKSETNKPVPSPKKLRDMRLLLLEEGHCFRDQALSFCEMSTAKPRYLMEGSSLSTLVQMVGAGMGVTLIPEMALPLETRQAQVSIARFPPPSPARSIGMVWRKTNPLAEKLMEVGAIVRQVGDAQRRCADATPA
ncbi:hydrogen peroxide-inducible genes activator [Aliiroseovarius sp. F47248L]|uniref:hydrogen peroxide-inducible genes activator n=1 Tax=Aliiroseovarius sp. F47248L TaxID=2926420 RepID=UPI001FF5D2C4|nr:hydrogen peroxide-inducible genes activator [Aliiroseovarius sp. F47248L]MCK0140733.1 hydrogen peroxide-inducible genes activator [Aliiroseovarius sp. F47248L]